MKRRTLVILFSLLPLLAIAFRPSPREAAQQLRWQDAPAFRAAEQAWKEEKWDEAIEQYRLFLRQDPPPAARAEAHYKIAFYLSYTASPEESIAEYEQAIALHPGSETAQEAKEGIAALRYSQGRYEDAQALFADIMRETEDWATFKESAYRFKEMTHLVALQKLPVKRSALDCGPRALEFACDQMGVRSAGAKLKPLYEVKGNGISLQQLREAARHAGLSAWGVRIKGQHLNKVPTPFIAHLRASHYWVITHVGQDRIDYVDPDKGASYLTVKAFLSRWRGDALVFSKRRMAEFVAQTLGPLEMENVRGGHHLHGDNLGDDEENPDTMYEGEEDPCPSEGLPHWSVNLANYNLLIQDTDFVYGSRGPAVRLTRTYNADASIESDFGRGWTFNYNVHLEFEPQGMIIVRRESGKKDSFTPRGDGSFTPPLWSRDKLTKAADGTYRLFLQRTLSTQHFNAQGDLVSIADRNGNAVTFQYQNNRLVSITDAVGRQTAFHYTGNGKISDVVDPLGRKALFDYDGDGNLTSYVDMAGNQVRYEYDRRSYLTSMTTPRGTTQFRIGTTPQFGDRPYVLKEIVHPNGTSTRFDTGNEIAWFTNPFGVQTFIFNNSRGETTEIENGLRQKTSFEFNDAGLERVVDATGATLQYAYDGSRGKLLSIRGPNSTLTKFTYDANENVIRIESAGKSATFEYDAKGNLTKAEGPQKSVTTYTYDSYGMLLSVTDPRSNTFSLGYDEKGNRNSFITKQATTTYGYDAIGRLTSRTDPKGNVFRYEYDGINRLSRLTMPDGQRIAYSYNCCSLASITGPGGTLKFESAPSGRLAKFTNSQNQTIGYEYDAEDRLISLTYPNGKAVKYQYDQAHRLKTVTDWLGNVTSYSYDASGRLISLVNPNGTVTGRRYDEANHVRMIVNTRPTSAPISVHRYTHDAAGHRVSTAESSGLGALAPKAIAYAYGGENRLTSSSNSSFFHDANGNLIRAQGAEQADYAFDPFNRLTDVTSQGKQYKYQYDALGNRVSRSVNGQIARYVVNPNAPLSQVLAETDAAGNVSAYYVYGLGLISKISGDNAVYTYHFDGNGNTVAITDQAQNVVNRYAYQPFGVSPSESKEAIRNDFKYAGQFGVFSEDDDLHYMRARYYKSSLGRFITQDPVGYASDLNGYAYAGNHPIGWIDPQGLWYVDITFSGAAFGLGGIFGGPSIGLRINGTGVYRVVSHQVAGSKNTGATIALYPFGEVKCGLGWSAGVISTGGEFPLTFGARGREDFSIGWNLSPFYSSPSINLGSGEIVMPAMTWSEMGQRISGNWQRLWK